MADLKAELAIFKKQFFGSGKNEKQDKAQLLLTLGQLEAKIAEVTDGAGELRAAETRSAAAAAGRNI